MKIVFFVHCFFPDHFYGTETYTLGLANHYRSWGHDVSVVSAVFQGEAKQPQLINRYSYQDIPVIAIDKNAIPHSRVKETYYQPEMRDVLEEILLELKPDVVHVTHLINHTAALLEVVGKLNIPTYTTFTDFFGFCVNNKLEAADGDLCAGPAPSRSNCVACYLKESAQGGHASGLMKKAAVPAMANILAKGLVASRNMGMFKTSAVQGLVEDLVTRPDTLSYLYNTHYKGAVAPTAFLQKAYQNNNIKVPMRKIWFGIDIDRRAKPVRAKDHVPVIGFIGQIAPHKGTDLLIEAFKQLPENSAKLKIYGPTDQSVSYMETLRNISNGVAGIEFMGTFDQGQMVDIFSDIDLFVIPSRWYENSPLVLLNSLATHTPVVVSDVEGMTEFLTEGVNGYSFKRGNADDLASKLSYILQQPDLLHKLSLSTEYLRTTEVMAKETFDIYQDR
ncbi:MULTISPECIES: glycosyltransferase family 4 protein [unclassified Serratia (in: enterobacteria)]|uniref:glycosyltransferase family 4 protein n=1 Tax=unclassified Serratia (in: enterobacteria) TaxID=2647522 RepID=UPI00046A028E|nr:MULTISPECIES: glycosyltransferase family 4 protein [unclassified Serratia (in: enterobacteria)]